MRTPTFGLLLALTPGVVLAQTPPPAAAAGPDTPITRAQYVARAAELAGRRFDAIDANHTGTITRAQMRAWRQAHRSERPPPQ